VTVVPVGVLGQQSAPEAGSKVDEASAAEKTPSTPADMGRNGGDGGESASMVCSPTPFVQYISCVVVYSLFKLAFDETLDIIHIQISAWPGFEYLRDHVIPTLTCFAYVQFVPCAAQRTPDDEEILAKKEKKIDRVLKGLVS